MSPHKTTSRKTTPLATLEKKMDADGVEFVRFEQSDTHGISRSKTIPVRHVRDFVEDGLNFLLGQYYVLTLFLIVAGLWLYRRHSPSLSALPVAIGAALKLYPVLFVVYYARKRQWRALLSSRFAPTGASRLGQPLHQRGRKEESPHPHGSTCHSWLRPARCVYPSPCHREFPP